MNILNIKMRYVGAETKGYMNDYNNALKEVLGDKLTIIDRIDNISASTVRDLISQGNIDKAMDVIPNGAKAIFYSIAMSKINM